jgi:hypothetical protein
VERGTHNELLSRGGLYKEIHDLQLIDHAKFTEEMEEIPHEDSKPDESSHVIA